MQTLARKVSVRKRFLVVLLLLGIAGFVGGSYTQSVADSNSIQSEVYANAQLLAFEHAAVYHNQTCSGPGACLSYGLRAWLDVYIHTSDLFPNPAFIAIAGVVPSCSAWCFGGITYFQDPTIVITNEGHDFIQYELTGSSHTVTPGSTDRATIEGVSSNTGTAAVTDSYAGTGPCSSANIATTAGFTPVAGTVTAGTPSGGSVTWTVTNTFTATGSFTIQAGCLITHLVGSGNPYIFGEGSGIGPFTMANTNTFQEVWQVQAT